MSEKTHVERYDGGEIYIEGDGKTTEHNGAVYQLYDNDNTARLLYVKKIKNGLLGSGDGVLTIPSTVKSLFKSYTVVGFAMAYYKKGTKIIGTGWKEDRRMKDGGYYTGTTTVENTNLIKPFQFIADKLKAVHFPDTWRDEVIPSIKKMAHMRNLEKVTIPVSWTKIEKEAFKDLYLTEINIPDKVTEIGESAFSFCNRLTTVNFNATNCTTMGSNNSPVFKGCFALKTLTIGENVTNIPNAAFYDCNRLTSVTIPNSVTSMGTHAFSGCSGLTAVYYTGSIAQWCSISFGIDGNPLTCAHNLYIDNNLVTNLVIPETLTEIKPCSFQGATCLRSVNIPNSVTHIGYYAFYDCSGLTEITIPNSVTRIGDEAFYGCSRLTSVIIGNLVTGIGEYAFGYCSGLTSVSIPNSVTSIGKGAFWYCSGLTSVTIPESVTSIVRDAFYNTRWYNNQSNGILYLSNWCLGYKGNKPTGELTINEGTRGIANYAFGCCFDLTSVTIPDSVTIIGSEAFRSCGLTSVTIPSSVTKIDEDAFSDCHNLKTVNVIGDEESELIRKAFLSGVKINYLGKKLAKKTENPVAKQEAKPADSDTTQAKEMPKEETPKAESKPTETETKVEKPKPAAKPATSDKDGLTVGFLAQAFKSQFGAVLRIYNGRSKADDGMSLQEVGLKQEINTTFDGKQTVGAFVEQMANAGLKVKVYTCDEWVAVLDGLTLEQAGKVKKSATKADMEKML